MQCPPNLGNVATQITMGARAGGGGASSLFYLYVIFVCDFVFLRLGLAK